MSYRPKLVAAAVALPLAASVWLATTRGPERPPPPPSLADRLVSADAVERQEAERELSEMPPDVAIDAVWDLEGRDDPTAREAAARLRTQVERQARDFATNGSRVRGDLPTDPPRALAAVLASFQRQTGNPSRLLAGQEGLPVTFKGADVPFWRAVDEVASQAGLAVGEGPLPVWRSVLTFHNRTAADDAARVGYAGAVRLAAGPATAQGDGGRRLIRVPLEVRTEPRLTPLFVSFAPSDLSLVTPDGRPLPLAATAEKIELRFGMTGKAVTTALDFVEPQDAAAGPFALAGRLTVAVAIDQETFQFPIRSDGPAEEVRGRTIGTRLLDARVGRDSAGFEVAFTGESPSRPAAGAVHDAQLVYPIRTPFWHDAFLPAVGRPAVTRTAGGEVVRYRFGAVPADLYSLSLHCRVATDVLEAPVKVALDGLPLTSAPLNAESAGGR